MNPEKQRIKIAEACGWKPQTLCTDFMGNPWPDSPPDYLRDLNAIHEAEKALTGEKWDDYAFQLATVTGWNQFTNRIAVYHASAAQRAEAFLKTLGLWEDGE